MTGAEGGHATKAMAEPSAPAQPSGRQFAGALHPGAPQADPPPPGALTPRIYYLDPLAAGPLNQWPAALDQAAALGFDHVLIGPIFAPGAHGDIFLPADFSRTHPALEWQQDAVSALRFIAELCRGAGLKLLLDIGLAELAGGSVAASAGPFLSANAASGPDPRHAAANAAQARLETAADAAALAEFWGAQLQVWAASGVGGFRLLGMDRLAAPHLPALVSALRDRLPGSLLLGWTPGMAWTTIASLAGCGLDHVFNSLPWWDWRGDWLWQELGLLRRVAPVITMPEAPYGPRLAASCHDPALLPGYYRRALAMAGLLGSAWMLPMGFAEAALVPMDPRHATLPPNGAPPHVSLPGVELGPEIRALNDARARHPLLCADGDLRLLSGPDAAVLAILRADAEDARSAQAGVMLLLNTDPAHRHSAAASALLPGAGAAYAPFQPIWPPEDSAPPLQAGDTVTLAPASLHAYAAPILPTGYAGSAPRHHRLNPEAARAAAAAPRLAIEAASPGIDGGAFAVKRIIGELVPVEADIIADGHDKLGVALHWQTPDGAWHRQPMRSLGNDRWGGEFPLRAMGRHVFTIAAWRDDFATFRDELGKKHEARVPTTLELQEGRALLAEAASRSEDVAALLAKFDAAKEAAQRQLLLSEPTADAMRAADAHAFAVQLDPPQPVDAERTEAGFAAWYEVFPRSLSDDESRHGSFDDVLRHLPRIRAMGFDVLYFPPIHPIGKTNRKGRNNVLRAAIDDPGSPYAIGSAEGGHDTVHPALGSIDDFRHLLQAASRHGLEIALDFAIQCAPDHPWLAQHPDWFSWRPDGSIRFAENPPKKYEDIVNVAFYAPGAIPDLWLELCHIVMFWADEGVRIFRVDNPHTKPLPFWEWLISEVRTRHPDVIFLAEAFTRPKVMYRLAKIGFSQSYTYFTWRNTPQELREYLTELTTTAPRDFFRPHFFVNTPDINPVFLHHSGRPGFLIRAALAATLSGLWGVYNGFELCEAQAVPGREEYADSEKYQLRAWDWNRPGNIVAEITALNRIRRDNPALRSHLGITFLDVSNDAVLYYEKATPDRNNVLLIAVSLDPYNAQDAVLDVPLWRFGLPDHGTLLAADLVAGGQASWTGRRLPLRLSPDMPYAIWRVRPAG